MDALLQYILFFAKAMNGGIWLLLFLSQIAAAVVTTIILTPILTQFVAKRVKRKIAKKGCHSPKELQ